MLSIIEEKGQESDELFLSVPAKSQWALTNKIYSEQHINWSEECILTVAYVLKVRQYFASPTFSIPIEMLMCFLSLRLPDHDSFLELWTHDLWIRVTVGKSLTSWKIHQEEQVNTFCWNLTFSYVRLAFFFWPYKCSHWFHLSNYTTWINSITSNNSDKSVFYKNACLKSYLPQKPFLLSNNSTK